MENIHEAHSHTSHSQSNSQSFYFFFLLAKYELQCIQLYPKMTQQGTKMTKRGPQKIRKKDPKLAQKGPKMTHQGPKMIKYGTKMAEYGPLMAKQGPKMVQQVPKMVQYGHKYTLRCYTSICVFFIHSEKSRNHIFSSSKNLYACYELYFFSHNSLNLRNLSSNGLSLPLAKMFILI